MTVGPVGVRAWFTRTKNEVDLEEARRAIATAAHGALFLFFQIGLENSLLSALLARREDPGFFLHGVISSQPQAPPASGEGRGVHHRKTHEEVIAGQLGFVHKNEPIQYAPDLVLPFAREKATEKWLAEFVKKNGAHAIVHSKVIVLDPFGDEPVVMTGSHNMGRTASGTNDENMVIVTGHAGLAAAYTAHIMSVYDNFRWRYRVAAGSKWKGSSRDPNWQRRYLDGKVPEFAFFTPTSD